MNERREEYLGDGVYASFDGYHVWLDTRGQNPVNRIALEPVVFDALVDYRKRLLATLAVGESLKGHKNEPGT